MKIALRNANPDDWPAILALHREQQALQGTKYELPPLFGSSMIPIVVVGCDESGAVLNCFYVEATAELRFVGCTSPQALAVSRRAADGLAFVLQQMGFRFLETFVPRQLKKVIEKPLKRAGFVDKDQELSYFSRDLRGVEKSAEHKKDQ